MVKKMFHLCLEGFGAREIARTLNDEGFRAPNGRRWDYKGILQILRNEVYIGTIIWNRKVGRVQHKKPEKEVIRVEDAHPAIVGKSEFLRVQRLLDERNPKVLPPRTLDSRYLFSGLVRCGQCGAHMVGTSAKGGRYHYYSCQNYIKRGKEACGAKLVPKELFETRIVKHIQHIIFREKKIEKLSRLVAEELSADRKKLKITLETTQRQLERHKTRLSSLYDALETGKLEIEDLAPRIKEIKSQVDELELRKV